MNATKIEAMANALQKRVPALGRATALQLAQRDARNLAAQPQWIRDCVGDYTRYPRGATVDDAVAIVRDETEETEPDEMSAPCPACCGACEVLAADLWQCKSCGAVVSAQQITDGPDNYER